MSSLKATRSPLRCDTCSCSCCSIACSYRSGYGSAALSPPLTVSQLPLLQEAHGGRCCVEPTCISLPQFVQRYVPADTSLPAGTGLAISAPFGMVGTGLSWERRQKTRDIEVRVSALPWFCRGSPLQRPTRSLPVNCVQHAEEGQWQQTISMMCGACALPRTKASSER